MAKIPGAFCAKHSSTSLDSFIHVKVFVASKPATQNQIGRFQRFAAVPLINFNIFRRIARIIGFLAYLLGFRIFPENYRLFRGENHRPFRVQMLEFMNARVKRIQVREIHNGSALKILAWQCFKLESQGSPLKRPKLLSKQFIQQAGVNDQRVIQQ